jgi:hypothetical protein
VPDSIGLHASSLVWPRELGGANRPSRLVRWNVYEAEDPYRQWVTREDLKHQQHGASSGEKESVNSSQENGVEGGESRLFAHNGIVFYAFENAVPHTERFFLESCEAPFRMRVQRLKHRFSRDISTWRPVLKAPCTANAAARRRSNLLAVGEAPRRDETEALHAFPLPLPGTTEHFVNWTSGPDRYSVTRGSQTPWGWVRLFSFHAYSASKFYMLERLDPLGYQLVKGPKMPVRHGWKCLFAFYAFDAAVPGSNCYYVETKSTPSRRMRLGMQPSSQWKANTSFYAFDVPVPGSSKFDVQLTTRSTETRDETPDAVEQYRIYLKDPWGTWENHFSFYAFTAAQVLLED